MPEPIRITTPAEGNLHLYESGFGEISFWDNWLFVSPWAPGRRVRRRRAMPVWLEAVAFVPRRAAKRAKP